MFKKDNGRIIPLKNYVYLGLVILFSFMVIFYFYMWYESYKDSLFQDSVVDDYLNLIQYNEIDDYIIENKDALIYVSVLGDEEVNKFEMKFINTIRDYSLREVMLYMNASELDKNAIDKKFNNSGDYPYIVVYTNGSVTDVYSISDKNYNTKKIIKYLNRIGVLSDD